MRLSGLLLFKHVILGMLSIEALFKERLVPFEENRFDSDVDWGADPGDCLW